MESVLVSPWIVGLSTVLWVGACYAWYLVGYRRGLNAALRSRLAMEEGR